MPNTNNNLLLLILKLTKKIKLLSILVRKTIAKPKKRCQNAKTIAHLFSILKQKIVAKAKKTLSKTKGNGFTSVLSDNHMQRFSSLPCSAMVENYSHKST